MPRRRRRRAAGPVGGVVEQTTLQPPAEARSPRGLHARAGRPRRRRINWFAYGLVAPAVAFMVLVHLLPTAGGVLLSFKRLNTFTFSRLFDAPWTGFENYTGVLFDSSNPLHDGFFGAVGNTVQYTLLTVTGTLVGGLLI